jgi:transposase-like protein
MARRKRRKFTPEFKAEAVRVARVGDRTIAQVAVDLDLTETALRDWIKRADADAARRGSRRWRTGCLCRCDAAIQPERLRRWGGGEMWTRLRTERQAQKLRQWGWVIPRSPPPASMRLAGPEPELPEGDCSQRMQRQRLRRRLGPRCGISCVRR